MSQVPFSAPGHEGAEPPLSGDGARDENTPGMPARGGPSPETPTPSGTPSSTASGADPGRGDDDWDYDADMARYLDDIEAGLIPIPPERDDTIPAAPPVMFTLGEAADVDPAVLAAMAGPDGLGGQTFDQDKAADALRPGPLLFILAENAAEDLGRLTDNELFGLVSASRRLQNRAEYLELSAIGEFTRRSRARYDASVAAKAKPGRRAGEFADAELAMELVTSARAAGDRMDLAHELATRLPCTFAGMAAGTIDGGKATTIWVHTQFLTDGDAAEADRILAAAAPRIQCPSLSRKAAAVEMRLDREGVRRRKEHARKEGRRVEARREASGNMALGGRELAVGEALAAKAANDADAAALRRAGMPGSLRELRVLAMLDRIMGRDPFDRLPAATATATAATAAATATATATGDDRDELHPDEADESCPDGEAGDGPGASPADAPGPLPATINLIVPAGTLLGWSAAPGDAGGWGLLDPGDTAALVQAASRHPRTRWCVTVTGTDGTAVAHGCARGPHRWTPPPPPPPPGPGRGPGGGRDGPGYLPGGTGPRAGPDEHQQAQLTALLRELNVTLSPVARGTCDHRGRENRYTPSRKLKDLVRARTVTCPAPGCGARAVHNDLDHTVAYPAGLTCQCDLSPPCRRHHRVKQAPGWRLEQPQPGIMRWTTPSGRTYTTTPTVYDL